MLNQVDKSAGSAKLQFLTFTLGDNHYCIDIHQVVEIRQYSEVTKVPESEEYFIGVLDIRGSVVPIFDLNKLFATNQSASSKKVIIIISLADKHVGMMVDTVSDIIEVENGLVKDVDSAKNAIKKVYLSGIVMHQGKMIMALNTDNIFNKKIIDVANQEG
ncbi:MAG: chemotaxis protein CheW [Rickettsiales bacterium]